MGGPPDTTIRSGALKKHGFRHTYTHVLAAEGSCAMAGQLFHIYRHVCTLNNLCAENMMVSSPKHKVSQ